MLRPPKGDASPPASYWLALVPKVSLGRHFPEAPLREHRERFPSLQANTGSGASGKCVPKQSLGTRERIRTPTQSRGRGTQKRNWGIQLLPQINPNAAVNLRFLGKGGLVFVTLLAEDAQTDEFVEFGLQPPFVILAIGGRLRHRLAAQGAIVAKDSRPTAERVDLLRAGCVEQLPFLIIQTFREMFAFVADKEIKTAILVPIRHADLHAQAVIARLGLTIARRQAPRHVEGGLFSCADVAVPNDAAVAAADDEIEFAVAVPIGGDRPGLPMRRPSGDLNRFAVGQQRLVVAELRPGLGPFVVHEINAVPVGPAHSQEQIELAVVVPIDGEHGQSVVDPERLAGLVLDRLAGRKCVVGPAAKNDDLLTPAPAQDVRDAVAVEVDPIGTKSDAVDPNAAAGHPS